MVTISTGYSTYVEGRFTVPTGYSTCMTWNDISTRMTEEATMASDYINASTTYVMWRE
jgi:hypothetical protein